MDNYFYFFVRKVLFTLLSCAYLLPSIAEASASEKIEQFYCAPNNNTINDACSNLVISAVTANSGETIDAVIVQMGNFNNYKISSAMLDNRKALISLATYAGNAGMDSFDSIMDQFSEENAVYTQIYGIGATANDIYKGTFHRKITTILKHRGNEYQVTQVGGSRNYTFKSNDDIDNLYIYTFGWATIDDTDDYNKIIDIVSNAIANQYYSTDERILFANASAAANPTLSEFTAFSSTCDLYKTNTILNTILKNVCSMS